MLYYSVCMSTSRCSPRLHKIC